MKRAHRLPVAIALAAAVLIVGRTAAVIYSEAEWLSVAGAHAVWMAHFQNALIIYGVALVTGAAFAWVNVSAVQRSVISLIVPKRLANVEFGEEVPSIRLRWLTAALSGGVAVAGLAAVPMWTSLALWRSDVVFGESDSYLNIDLGYFVAWLPLESQIYAWSLTVFAFTSVLVVALYALTPSLSWTKGALRVSAYARRHIAVLSAILMLFAAWSFRLAAFKLLIAGSGDGGAFTRIDHTYLVPADWILSVVAVGAAFVLLLAGWMGQTTTALATVSVVILGAATTQLVGPWASQRIADAPGTSRQEVPYLETRKDFTQRAFPVMQAPPSVRFLADSTLVARAGQLQLKNSLPDLIFPGALGPIVVRDPLGVVVSPRIGSGVIRMMHAWADQNPRLFNSSITSDDAYLTTRDVRARVASIAPLFSQSTALGAVPTARGLLWIVDLYSTSDTYPIAEPRASVNVHLTYRHHAGTAYVSGGTGQVAIVADSVLDPMARAWFDRYGGPYLTPGVPRVMAQQPQVPIAPAPSAPGTDTVFRAHVTQMYERMRSSLGSRDLKAFGAAFDSLGRIIQAGH